VAGIARWLNENIEFIKSGEREEISKREPGILGIHRWVQQQYDNGRTTSISSEELMAQARHFVPSLFVSNFELIQQEVKNKALGITSQVVNNIDVNTLNSQEIEQQLRSILAVEHSIHLLAITDLEGNRISQVHTQWGEKNYFRNLLTKNFKDHFWFTEVMNHRQAYCSEIYHSSYTKDLIITTAVPLMKDENIIAIVDVDFKFNELEKLRSSIPEEILRL
jgi:hypothetical protein